MDSFEYGLDEGATDFAACLLAWDMMPRDYHLAMSLMRLDSEMRGWIAWVYE
jgi:hypothetical protein